MKDIRDLAYDFMSKQKSLIKLPVKLADLSRVAEDNGWDLLKYSEAEPLLDEMQKNGVDISVYKDKHNGFAVYYCGKIMIFYKDGMSNMDTIHVICHEIAHVVLRHLSSAGTIYGKADSEAKTNAQEAEANAFAMEMMAPLPVLNQLEIKSATDIEQMGILPGNYATKQYENLIVVRERSYVAQSDSEIQLCEHFKDEIKRRRCHDIKVLEENLVNKFESSGQIKRLRESIERKRKLKKIGIPAIIFVFIIGCCTIFYAFGKNTHIPPSPMQEPSLTQQNIAPSSKPTEAYDAAPTERSTIDSKIVYITKSGNKYHEINCPYVSGRTTFSMTIENAEKSGYEACKSCLPNK